MLTDTKAWQNGLKFSSKQLYQMLQRAMYAEVLQAPISVLWGVRGKKCERSALSRQPDFLGEEG